MKRYTIIILAFILSGGTLSAQNAVDALRYSRINTGGTARYMGMSGAFGALGADFTSASTNPAGIGLYRSFELSITPSVFTGATKSGRPSPGAWPDALGCVPPQTTSRSSFVGRCP